MLKDMLEGAEVQGSRMEVSRALKEMLEGAEEWNKIAESM